MLTCEIMVESNTCQKRVISGCLQTKRNVEASLEKQTVNSVSAALEM
jgi:hypothetical protein